MPTPIRCPEESCPSRLLSETEGIPIWRKGWFRRRDLRAVRRYQCKTCGRHFSDQTFSPGWRRRRCDVDQPLRELLSRGVSLRAAARLLGVNRKTVERRARDPRFAAAPG